MVVQQTQNDAQGAILAQANGNFFSSGIRQKVDRWMDTLWAGGVNNPMDSIEQLSYLLFLRLLSERDDQFSAIQPNYKPIFSGEWSKYSWGNFVTLTGDELFDTLREAIEKLHELPGLTQTGKEVFRNANLKIYDRPTLRAIIQSIDTLDLTTHDGRDMKGDMYEYLLSKLSQSGTNGQFRTPRHIVNLIVALVNPQPGERIIDPACGTGGFLVSAYNHILKAHTAPEDLAEGIVDGSLLTAQQEKFLEEEAFTGHDNDANMVKLAIMNLYLHQLDRANVTHFNPLTTRRGGDYPGQLFDVILANPPFAGKIEKESILPDINLASRNTELLFMKWFLDHLAENGRAGVIVPNGVLFGSGKAQKKIRELLLTECDLQAVISLPSGVFKPYSGVGTAILVFQQGGPTESVWFYDLTADGFSLDDKRTPTSANDIPDVLEKFPNREEGPNSYRVSIDTIRENDLSLAAGRYKPIEIKEVHHDDPADILREIIEIEREIIARSGALLAEIGGER